MSDIPVPPTPDRVRPLPAHPACVHVDTATLAHEDKVVLTVSEVCTTARADARGPQMGEVK